jgi:hypothetical protein
VLRIVELTPYKHIEHVRVAMKAPVAVDQCVFLSEVVAAQRKVRRLFFCYILSPTILKKNAYFFFLLFPFFRLPVH